MKQDNFLPSSRCCLVFYDYGPDEFTLRSFSLAFGLVPYRIAPLAPCQPLLYSPSWYSWPSACRPTSTVLFIET